MKFKQVKGFTLLEAVVAMMLTSMLAILVVSGVLFYQRLFGIVVESGSKQREICFLYLALKHDSEVAERIVFEGELMFVSEFNNVIVYNVQDDFVVRTQEVEVDTFYVKSKLIQFETVRGADNLIDYILLECQNGDLKYPVSIYKQYSLGVVVQNKELWQ